MLAAETGAESGSHTVTRSINLKQVNNVTYQDDKVQFRVDELTFLVDFDPETNGVKYLSVLPVFPGIYT